jgi:hypothetical protein
MGRRSEPERENPDLVVQDGVLGGIEELPRKVDRYAVAKKVALEVVDYIGSSEHALPLAAVQKRLSTCGDYLVFRHYFTVNRVKLHGASLCDQHLLCALCAIRRGSKFLKAYMVRWDAIKAENPNLRPYLVTLTVKTGPDLAERFAHLKKSQGELWKRKQRARGSPLDGVAGAVWSYEIKRGSGSGLWHPHLHMIALAESLPTEGVGNHGALSAEWHNITGDSFMVDVRPIDFDNVASGFVEVFKYAVKFSDQPPCDTVHAFLTLRGKRLLASSGCFRGVPEPAGLLDDAESLKDLPYITLFYRYLNGRGYSL